MTLMSWVLFLFSIAMVAWTGYYSFRGRELYRSIILINLLISIQFMTVYCIIVFDTYFQDILSREDITCYLVKPLIAALALMLSVNTFFLGRKHD